MFSEDLLGLRAVLGNAGMNVTKTEFPPSSNLHPIGGMKGHRLWIQIWL